MYWRRKWPWIGRQTWQDIVFLHWPVCENELRPYVPDPLVIDQYDGYAWISVVFFQTNDSRLRSFTSRVSYPVFHQLNVRTYVKFGEEPGVYFFTLSANSPLIVKGGQLLGLPYVQTEMAITKRNKQTSFTSMRLAESQVTFSAQYKEGMTPFIAKRGSLSNWLTERYCIWLINGSRIMKAPISHLPWVLYDVEVEVNMQHLLPGHFNMREKPLANYAKFMTAYAHPFERFGIFN